MLLQKEIRTPVVDLTDEDWTNDEDDSENDLPPEEPQSDQEEIVNPTEEDLE